MYKLHTTYFRSFEQTFWKCSSRAWSAFKICLKVFLVGFRVCCNKGLFYKRNCFSTKRGSNLLHKSLKISITQLDTKDAVTGATAFQLHLFLLLSVFSIEHFPMQQRINVCLSICLKSKPQLHHFEDLLTIQSKY